MKMDAKHLLERVLILAVLFIAILQLGGSVVRADMNGGPAGSGIEAGVEGLSEKCCRMVGFPHNDLEAAELLMQAFR